MTNEIVTKPKRARKPKAPSKQTLRRVARGMLLDVYAREAQRVAKVVFEEEAEKASLLHLSGRDDSDFVDDAFTERMIDEIFECTFVAAVGMDLNPEENEIHDLRDLVKAAFEAGVRPAELGALVALVLADDLFVTGTSINRFGQSDKRLSFAATRRRAYVAAEKILDESFHWGADGHFLNA